MPINARSVRRGPTRQSPTGPPGTRQSGADTAGYPPTPAMQVRPSVCDRTTSISAGVELSSGADDDALGSSRILPSSTRSRWSRWAGQLGARIGLVRRVDAAAEEEARFDIGSRGSGVRRDPVTVRGPRLRRLHDAEQLVEVGDVAECDLGGRVEPGGGQGVDERAERIADVGRHGRAEPRVDDERRVDLALHRRRRAAATLSNDADATRPSRSASRVSQPTVSKVGASGSRSVRRTAPWVVRSPQSPWYDAGTRIDPPVSVPSPMLA